jgi:hypothetical protein
MMMKPASHCTPYPRPLEINDIDHAIRCHGGRTVATDMEPGRMAHSKRSENFTQYLDFLNRRIGELRLELAFYRAYYEHGKHFEHTIDKISQDLLHETIISILDDSDWSQVREIARAIVVAIDEFAEKQKEALDSYIAPYKASNLVTSDHSSTTEWI